MISTANDLGRDVNAIYTGEAEYILDIAKDTGTTTMLLGPPGCGKSSIPQQFASKWGMDFKRFLLAGRELTDVFGIPMLQRESGTFAMATPEEFYIQRPTLFLWDEFPLAFEHVQAAVGTVIYDGYVGSMKLPDGCMHVLTGNRATDGAAASEIPTNIAGRVWMLELKARATDWIRDFAIPADVHPYVMAFVQANPDLLIEFDPDRMFNLSPRVWEGVSDLVKRGILDAPGTLAHRALRGRLGDAANQFIASCILFRKLPSITQVILNPASTPIPDDLASQFFVALAVSKNMDEANANQCIDYLTRMPAEIQTVAIKYAAARKPDVCKTMSFTRWSLDNQSLLSAQL